MRKFYLENELGQRYDLQNVTSVIFSQIEGLGISYNSQYIKTGSRYVINSKEKNIGQLTGKLEFIGAEPYKEYQKFISFVLKSLELKIIYIPIKEEYYIDVDINVIQKGEKNVYGILECPATFYIKSPFYKMTKNIYKATSENIQNKWDFNWDFKFSDYTTAEMIVQNNGLNEASFEFYIKGYTENPSVKIYYDNKLISLITFDVIVDNNETLYYSNIDDSLVVQKIDEEGNKINIFNCLDLNNNNFQKLLIGSNKFVFSGEMSEIELLIYEEWEQI